MADQPPELLVADQAAWRTWLADHHDDPSGVRLVLAKKGVVDPTSLTYVGRSPDDGGSFTAARRSVEDAALQLLGDLLPNVAAIELPWLAGEIGTRGALGEIAARI